MPQIKLNYNVNSDTRQALFFIAGPCVIESESSCIEIADFLKKTCLELNVELIFKASFDKANRTSLNSFRGPGLEKGLEILKRVKERVDVPVLTDIHLPSQAEPAARVVDILQIPAFLCRQTDLVTAAARTGLPVNIKKGQFMAPDDMLAVIEKMEAAGNPDVILCERGTCFGYHKLIVDMRSIYKMKKMGKPVVFDMTHSTQQPGALGNCSGGESELALPLAKAAIAVGADGIFMETHPNPDAALSDAATMLPLDRIPEIMAQLLDLFNNVR